VSANQVFGKSGVYVDRWDLFVAGEDLAGITDALRWKSPRIPLAYNRNLAAEAGAVGRLARKLE